MLWPGRITACVRLLLSAVGGEPRAPTEPPSPLISKCMRALELLGKYVGGRLQHLAATQVVLTIEERNKLATKVESKERHMQVT